MTKSALAIAALAAVLFSTAAFAGPVTQEERQYCAYDYRDYAISAPAQKQIGAAKNQIVPSLIVMNAAMAEKRDKLGRLR